MIVGTGIDIVEIARIHRSLERFGTVFIDRILHYSELADLPDDLLSQNAIAHVAGRFAAKEAAVKALGTGFSAGIGLHDIRIANLSTGQPVLSLHRGARARASLIGAHISHISLSHEKSFAVAMIIFETAPIAG